MMDFLRRWLPIGRASTVEAQVSPRDKPRERKRARVSSPAEQSPRLLNYACTDNIVVVLGFLGVRETLQVEEVCRAFRTAAREAFRQPRTVDLWCTREMKCGCDSISGLGEEDCDISRVLQLCPHPTNFVKIHYHGGVSFRKLEASLPTGTRFSLLERKRADVRLTARDARALPPSVCAKLHKVTVCPQDNFDEEAVDIHELFPNVKDLSINWASKIRVSYSPYQRVDVTLESFGIFSLTHLRYLKIQWGSSPPGVSTPEISSQDLSQFADFKCLEEIEVSRVLITDLSEFANAMPVGLRAFYLMYGNSTTPDCEELIAFHAGLFRRCPDLQKVWPEATLIKYKYDHPRPSEERLQVKHWYDTRLGDARKVYSWQSLVPEPNDARGSYVTRNLTSLHLRVCVTDKYMDDVDDVDDVLTEALRGCPLLKTLNLRFVGSPSTLFYLRFRVPVLPRLRKLGFTYDNDVDYVVLCRTTIQSLHKLPALTSLGIFDLVMNSIDSFGPMVDEGHALHKYALKRLTVGSCKSSPQCIENALECCPRLESLKLYMCSRASTRIHPMLLWHERFQFPVMKNLSEIVLSSHTNLLVFLPPRFFASMRELPALAQLWLTDVVWDNGKTNGSGELAGAIAGRPCALHVSLNCEMKCASMSIHGAACSRDSVEWALDNLIAEARERFSRCPFEMTRYTE